MFGDTQQDCTISSGMPFSWMVQVRCIVFGVLVLYPAYPSHYHPRILWSHICDWTSNSKLQIKIKNTYTKSCLHQCENTSKDQYPELHTRYIHTNMHMVNVYRRWIIKVGGPPKTWCHCNFELESWTSLGFWMHWTGGSWINYSMLHPQKCFHHAPICNISDEHTCVCCDADSRFLILSASSFSFFLHFLKFSLLLA